MNEWFWEFNINLSISRNLSTKSIQTLFLMAASERIANSKSGNLLSISTFMPWTEMNFWNFTLEGWEAEQMQCNNSREIQ